MHTLGYTQKVRCLDEALDFRRMPGIKASEFALTNQFCLSFSQSAVHSKILQGTSKRSESANKIVGATIADTAIADSAGQVFFLLPKPLAIRDVLVNTKNP